MVRRNGILPDLGFGLGLRPSHYAYIFEHRPEVDWFEIISENYMDTDGRPKRNLMRIAENYPIVMHGVGLSIGSINPLDLNYLKKLKQLMSWVKPVWISDHLCWTGNAHANTHDLLPMPYTEEALKHITERICRVQDILGRPMAFENPSTYLEFKSSSMPEAEFIARMVEGSGCYMLLDVNNVYVTCYNHRLDPKSYLDVLPLEKVIQIHLSGHTHCGTHIIDTHDDHVIDDVWNLYGYVVQKAGRIPNTMIEWDDNIPGFPVLYAELAKAKNLASATEYEVQLPALAVPRISVVTESFATLDIEQQRMQEAILLGDNYDSKPAEWIYPKEQFAPADQLDVYVNAYRARLYGVTEEDYPVLNHYLGAETFDDLITRFVNTIRSDYFNIGRFSAKLPAFLIQYRPDDRFAYELCVLENAVSQLADSEETTVLNSTHLVGLTPDKLMSMVLHPRKALQLLVFNYPVNAYYCAVNQEQPVPDICPGETYLAVFRHEDVMWRMDLDSREYKTLQMLFSGKSVGSVLESIVDPSGNETDIVSELYGWFGRWIHHGLLAYRGEEMRLSEGVAV